MKKRILTVITAAIMTGVLTVSSLLPSFVISASADNSKSDNEIIAEANASASVSLAYAEYINAHKDAAYAQNAVSVQIGAVVDKNAAQAVVNVPAAGLYTFGLTYKALGEEIVDLKVSLSVDGASPFAEVDSLNFPRVWQDDAAGRSDALGNEVSPEQIPFDGFYSWVALDVTRQSTNPYLIYLSEGSHNLSVSSIEGSFELKSIDLGVYEVPDKYSKPQDKEKYYSGDRIVVEAENPIYKNGYWLISRSDNSTAKVTPTDAAKSILNYIGGGTWKAAGEAITWETPELEAGYYQLGFSFRQSTVIGGKAYRALTIDGKTPFAEATSIGFPYDDNWQQSFYADSKDKPYLIYLSKGKHQITLTAVPGEAGEICDLLRQIISELNSLYLKIMMITGENVDTYRDYDLFSQITDMEERLESVSEMLSETIEKLKKLNGEETGSHTSVLSNMLRVVELMLENKYIAHRYVGEYYDCYTSVASVLEELTDVSLDIDKFSLTAAGEEHPFEKTGVLTQFGFSCKRFIVSFFNDYNGISDIEGSKEPITVWINWGRDQAQVFNTLIKSKFTEKHGIAVNVKLAAASVVQGLISGNGPDCILQQSRSEPVNLAMRGSLYDLNNFDDIDDVLKRFQDGAEIPYRYKDGLYALPDSQSFYVMFYRKDILDELGLKVPETWDDFKNVTKFLARRNLTVYLPNNVATNAAQTNAGVGSINIFPTLVLQKGLSLYSEDGRSTTLSDAGVMTAFIEWTDFYRKLGVPKALNFYNRFRIGTCPIGIENYSLYTTLKAAAPEIDGLWDIALVPGTALEDGSVSHTVSGSGSGCAILNTAKNPQDAWEFLKWWTEADTQLSYSNEVESLVGSTGRMSVSNVEALKKMSWDGDMRDTILAAWDEVEEVPEYPGSYYLSRSLYQSYWNVVNRNQNPKDVLLKYGKQADEEIERKWQQYD